MNYAVANYDRIKCRRLHVIRSLSVPRSSGAFLAWAVFIAYDYNIHYNVPMSNKLKITTVGNSAGIVLPREILERLRVEKGDTLYALETPNGIELTAFDEEFADDMAVAEKVMRDNRDLLRKLAE